MQVTKTFLICLFLSSSVIAQEISWTSPKETDGLSIQIESEGNGTFYSFKKEMGVMRSRCFLARYEDGQCIADRAAPSKTPTGKGRALTFAVVDGIPYTFLWEYSKGMMRLYGQPCNRLCEATGSAILLAEIPRQTVLPVVKFECHFSPNRRYMLVVGTRHDPERWQRIYSVFDLQDGFQKIDSGTTDFTSTEDYFFEVNNDFVTDQGVCIGIVDRVKQPLDKIILDRKLVVYNEAGDLEVPIDLPEGSRISNVKVLSDKSGQLFVFGAYNVDTKHTPGLYYMKVNSRTGNVSSSNMKLLSTSEGADNQPYLTISDVIARQDGTFIAFLENSYNISGGSGVYYVNNDLFVTKILPTGDPSWVHQIQKSQVTFINGFYNSYFAYTDEDELHLFYNDNARNYVDGVRIEGDTLADFELPSGQPSILAEAVIGLSDGSATTGIALSLNPDEMIPAPQSFAYDETTRELIFYRSTRKDTKESYGIMRR